MNMIKKLVEGKAKSRFLLQHLSMLLLFRKIRRQSIDNVVIGCFYTIVFLIINSVSERESQQSYLFNKIFTTKKKISIQIERNLEITRIFRLH